MTSDRDSELDEEDEERDVGAGRSASKEPVSEDSDAPDSTDADVEEDDEGTSHKAVDDDEIREEAKESDAYETNDEQ